MKKRKHSYWLLIGAIGIVFGDIGTSPLYAMQAIYGVSGMPLDAMNIIGAVSLIIWAITIVVAIKYIGFMMQAGNGGEGGIMALIALLRRTDITHSKKAALTLLALVGVSLFYGDSVITPAISVLSALEGTRIIAPGFTPYIVPATIIVLSLLFLVQSRGTGNIGRFFGPVMIVWFGCSATAGLFQLINEPAVLSALLPTTAVGFFIEHPFQGFLTMGAVILAVTGAEALYADMGHFGRSAITKAWFFVVFPALVINYLGQGALIMHHPDAVRNSYFLLYPEWAQLPAILIATLATLIASQAVISGAFSLTRQAVQLGFAPRLTIRHTSNQEAGQVYVPFLNWLLALLIVIVVLVFGTSEHLAGAFGMAVSGTLVIDTILLLVVMKVIWKRPPVIILCTAVLFLTIDLLFLSSSTTKLLHGAWLPILIGAAGFTLLSTWYRGHTFVTRERHRLEGSLLSFVIKLRHTKITRIPGQAIYIGHHVGNAPLALHETVEQLHELHENVVVVTVQTTDKPHVPESLRVIFDGLGHPDDGISHVTLRFGYKDMPNVPKALQLAREKDPEVDFDPQEATYFTSVSHPVIVHNRRMSKWRKHLYLLMDRNANDPSGYFKLPLDRTIEMRTFLEL